MKTTLDSSGKQIQRQAAEWLALRQARGFTIAERASFAAWRDSDSRHAEIFRDVEAAWGALDQLARYPHSADVAADPDLLRPAQMKTRLFAFPRLVGAPQAPREAKDSRPLFFSVFSLAPPSQRFAVRVCAIQPLWNDPRFEALVADPKRNAPLF